MTFYFHDRNQNIYLEDISYDPLVYIEKHLTACLENGNLEIYVDKENALKSCFSEDGIQIFYILDGKEIPLKLGSNNIMQENITDKINFKITNKNET